MSASKHLQHDRIVNNEKRGRTCLCVIQLHNLMCLIMALFYSSNGCAVSTSRVFKIKDGQKLTLHAVYIIRRNVGVGIKLCGMESECEAIILI